MAITINYTTRVITIPQSFLTFISTNLYELNVNDLRLALKDLEDSEDGMTFPHTHRHNTQVVLSGVTYARSLEIINGYTVTFENGNYSVRCVGANHNLADVKNINYVSLIVGNAAGLVVTGMEEYTAEVVAVGDAVDVVEGAVGDVQTAVGSVQTAVDGVQGAIGEVNAAVLAVPNAAATATVASTVDATLSLRETLSVLLAILTGRVTGGGTPTITFKDPTGVYSRVVMHVDANGNRLAVTLEP